jgi:hypothetical protein
MVSSPLRNTTLVHLPIRSTFRESTRPHSRWERAAFKTAWPRGRSSLITGGDAASVVMSRSDQNLRPSRDADRLSHCPRRRGRPHAHFERTTASASRCRRQGVWAEAEHQCCDLVRLKHGVVKGRFKSISAAGRGLIVFPRAPSPSTGHSACCSPPAAAPVIAPQCLPSPRRVACRGALHKAACDAECPAAKPPPAP